MEILKISKRDFNSFIEKKIAGNSSRTVGVVRKGSHYVFDDLKSPGDLCLDYDVTLLPPKKYFLPQREVLLKFVPRKADSYKAVNNRDPLTIIGIHYYDLAAIYLMDRAFAEGERDEHYLGKRENSLLIGLFPTRPFKHRFARSVVRDQYYRAADLMLVEMGEEYAIEVVTDKGKEYLHGSRAGESDYSLKEIDEAKHKIKDDQRLPVPHETSPEYLDQHYGHRVWDHFGEKCFSCGSCVLVCPTCYCFDVREEIDLSLEQGRRTRVWDGCMLEDFAVVAEGHNFRASRGARFRHRLNRKARHLPEKFGYWGCVGCGRCADACTADIAGPVKIFKFIEENR